MEYAISLYFDEKSTASLKALIELAAKATGNSYMLDHNIPPHVTVSYFTSENIDNVITIVSGVIGEIPCGTICWSSLGAFPPTTLFTAPTVNTYLVSMNRKISSLLNRKVIFNDFYLPNLWVPHTSLAYKLNATELYAGFSALAPEFSVIKGAVEKLAIASCEPYADITVFELY
jgi:hypothetical protein